MGCGFTAGINWLNSVGGTSNQAVFGELGWRPILSIVFYAVYGLSISFVLKKFGAMTRTFINATGVTPPPPHADRQSACS